jgi:lysophospholipase L1-like esterase
VAALRKILATFVLVVASVALVLGVAEIAVRWLDRSPRMPPERPLDPALADLPELTTVKMLGSPNARGRHGPALFRTNSAGFRGREYSLAPPPDTFRIALIGDSVSMGWKTDEAATYAMRVERMLDEASSTARFEVLNLGLGGLNTRLIVNRLQRIGLAYAPDLIVYGFTLNDIETPQEFGVRDASAPEPLIAQWQRFADSPSHLLRMLWPRWVSIRTNVLHRPGSYGDQLDRWYFEEPDKWARVAVGLDRLAAIGRARGICIHLLIHSEMAQFGFFHPFVRIYDRLEAASTARGFSVTQSYPAFRWRSAPKLRISPLDNHPNDEGHRILAEALVEDLKQLPGSCGLPLD